MAQSFLHGVEVVSQQKGTRSIAVVRAGVIGLVGISPEGPINEPILVQSEKDAEQFGSKLSGFTIPQAIEAIQLQGAGTIVVVNVFDPALHATDVADEAVSIAGGSGQLAAAPLTAPVLAIGATTLVAGTDYAVDENGKITVLDAVKIPDGSAVVADYSKLNPAAITGALLVGADSESGAKALALSANLFGFTPKILIAPGFMQEALLRTQLLTYADKVRGRVLVDAPAGTTVAGALAGRGPAGTIGLNTSNKRQVNVYPELKSVSGYNFPYSAYLAGVWAATINELGYWHSPSNKEIKGVTGAAVKLTAGISDAQSDVNLLNAAGIVSVFNTFGTGLRTWGNRSAAFPTETTPDQFLSVLLTADIIHESIEQASLQFVDKPINQAVIDSIRETVNSFLRTLQGRGAIIDGKCSFNQDNNPEAELAAGHISFDIEFMPPTPAERITFNSFIDISLLSQLR